MDPGPPLDVVLDVDTGVDDALALLLAARSPRVRLLAVTCVEGNVDVDLAVGNTLAVLKAAGADVPVARGAGRPLAGPPSGGRPVHGPDGLAGLTSGPGAHLAHDPEAAAAVLASGVPVTAYGTGVLPLAAVPAGTARRLAASPDAGTRLAGLLLAHQVRRAGGGPGSLGDAGALAAALDPGGLTVQTRGLRAGVAGDERGRLVAGPHAVDVATGVDGARYGAAFVGAVERTG